MPPHESSFSSFSTSKVTMLKLLFSSAIFSLATASCKQCPEPQSNSFFVMGVMLCEHEKSGFHFQMTIQVVYQCLLGRLCLFSDRVQERKSDESREAL